MKRSLSDNSGWRWVTCHSSLCWSLAGIMAIALLPKMITIPYYLHVLILVMLYGGLASAWNLMGGYTGLLSLGHAAFFGLGAYSSTLLYLRLGVSPWAGMAAGAIVAAVAGVITCYPSLRLKGPFFALASLAFAEVLRIISVFWVDLTAGSNGLTIRYRPGFEYMMWPGKEMWVYLLLAYLLLVVGTVWKFQRSKLGFYAVALREDDGAARMLGIDTTKVKLYVTMASASFTAIGGSLYAQYMSYIDPYAVFDPAQSVQFALIGICGGMGTVFGPVFGAFIMVPLSEFLQGTLGGSVRGLNMTAYGIMLMVVVMTLPQGVYPALMERYRQWRNARAKAAAAALAKEGQVDVA